MFDGAGCSISGGVDTPSGEPLMGRAAKDMAPSLGAFGVCAV